MNQDEQGPGLAIKIIKRTVRSLVGGVEKIVFSCDPKAVKKFLKR
jgi:hypothetical protein